MKKLVVLISLITLITGCSSSHTPAPVTTLKTDSSEYSKKINIVNSRYKVKAGDTLFAIAFSANQDVRTIAKLNNIKPPYTIYPGQIIATNNTVKQNNQVKKQPKVNRYSNQKIQKNNIKDKKELAKPMQREYVQKQANKKPNNAKSLLHKEVRWGWPTTGKLTKRFSNQENGYKGIQIVNAKGTGISAAADGVVVYAGNALRGYGNLVIIKHTDDFLSAYAHNSKLFVKEQQRIKRGQKIAEMGDTDARRVALRFEIRYKGQAVDPKKYLPSR